MEAWNAVETGNGTRSAERRGGFFLAGTAMDAKKLRILFVDDEELEIVPTLKKEGYDVEHWTDVESLDKLVDGRFQIIFLDVRGIGAEYGGTGLDVLKYVAMHNPLIFAVVFSAKPFSAADNEITRQYASKVLTKDCSAYDFMETIDDYAASITKASVLNRLENVLTLGWFARWKISHGKALSSKQIEKIAKSSDIAYESLKIVANVTAITVLIVKAIMGH